MRRGYIGFLAFMTAALVACGSSTSSSSPATSSTVKTVPARPAGVSPSASSKMVCALEAQKEIAASVGVPVISVSAPTWIDHTYSCRYVYPDGSFVLTVKELDSAAQTTSYFDALATRLGRDPNGISIGEGAFLTHDGSVVARKDWKVLLIDVSQLPTQFGQPAQTPSNVALTVGETVMGCWTGE